VQQAKRRLAAVLAADVAGYTRLMREDEDTTIDNWWAHRRNVIDPTVADFSGRVVKLTGDGFLAEFGSATNAILAAWSMQNQFEASAAEQPESLRMRFRIGVNLGEIVWDDEDIYGDGVNIAARLESIAEPGTVIVSQSVFDQVKRTAQLAFDCIGPQALKNIAEPVTAYRVVCDLSSHSYVSGDPGSIPRRAREAIEPNSLAVLPFDVFGGDSEQEYFADGFTEDLITELSRFKGLFLTSRNSSFAFKGQALDLRDLGKRLGVAFGLEGSVRKMGERVRITAQLINTRSGNHVWAEKYDCTLDHLFEVQDALAQSIVANVAGRMERDNLAAARQKKPADMAAYDCLLRGLEHHRLGGVTREAAEQAVHWFGIAIEKDPNYGLAHAWRACSLDALSVWTGENYFDEEIAEVSRALELDENDAEAHRIMGSICMGRRDFEKTEYHFQRALALNPNNPWILGRIGELYNFLGDSRKALEYQQRAVVLDPLLPAYCREIEVIAQYIQGSYEQSAQVVSQLLHKSLRACAYNVAAYCHLDDEPGLERARAALMAVSPGFSIDRFLEKEHYRDDDIPRRLREDLEHAGLE
jgi:adenylate cyclase